MVLLTVTDAAQKAIEAFRGFDAATLANDIPLEDSGVGSPIEHWKLVEISKTLVQQSINAEDADVSKHWRLDALLKGSTIYRPPPPPKKEQTPEYQALMAKLRKQEEHRQYERMINPPQANETFGQRFPNAPNTFEPMTSIGQHPPEEVDEMTYADVNRQMALIINVLVSIICCSVAIWMAARRWSVPSRLALSMFGSVLVAVAEVAIYFGYIRRVRESKEKEVKKLEQKEVMETWVIDQKSSAKPVEESTVRFRKGKNR